MMTSAMSLAATRWTCLRISQRTFTSATSHLTDALSMLNKKDSPASLKQAAISVYHTLEEKNCHSEILSSKTGLIDLVELMGHDKTEVRSAAAVAVARAAEDNDCSERLREIGAIGGALKLLSSEELVLRAAGCASLGNILTLTSNCETLLDEGGLDIMVPLLQEGQHDAIRKGVASCFASLGAVEVCQQAMLEEGVVELVLAMLRDQAAPAGAREAGASALAGCMQHAHTAAQDTAREAGGVDTLVTLMGGVGQDIDTELRQTVLWAAACAVEANAPNLTAFGEAGGVHRLVSILEERNKDLDCNALICLSQSLQGHADNQVRFLEAGGLGITASLLSLPPRYTHVLVHCCRAVAAAAASATSAHQLEEVTKQMELLLQRVEDGLTESGAAEAGVGVWGGSEGEWRVLLREVEVAAAKLESHRASLAAN